MAKKWVSARKIKGRLSHPNLVCEILTPNLSLLGS